MTIPKSVVFGYTFLVLGTFALGWASGGLVVAIVAGSITVLGTFVGMRVVRSVGTREPSEQEFVAEHKPPTIGALDSFSKYAGGFAALSLLFFIASLAGIGSIPVAVCGIAFFVGCLALAVAVRMRLRRSSQQNVGR